MCGPGGPRGRELSVHGLVIERFFQTLRCECLWVEHFYSLDDARTKIDAWIERSIEEPGSAGRNARSCSCLKLCEKST